MLLFKCNGSLEHELKQRAEHNFCLTKHMSLQNVIKVGEGITKT